MPTNERSAYQLTPLPTLCICLVFFLSCRPQTQSRIGGETAFDIGGQLCWQAKPLIPTSNDILWRGIDSVLRTEEYQMRAMAWLTGAVKIPEPCPCHRTETFDDMGPVGSDPHWEVFGLFHDYLFHAFPLVLSTLSLTKVNTYGILLTWNGSDPTKTPVLLAAHQDVVPVDPMTLDQWKHPPYSGFFDGERIWGRGTSDDKNGLIGILASIELLLEHGFNPNRTIVIAFGFDEEASGEEGADKLAVALTNTYGEDAFAMIIDEGDGFGEQYGTVFATPSVTEKGYLDVKLEVTSPGGHSSVPPAHSSIGLLSTMLVELEANQHPTHLDRDSPVFLTLQCLAAHASDLPSDFRQRVEQASHSEQALHDLEEELSNDHLYGSLMRTTQAITMIRGGIKANALPERAWALVNHRISPDSSVTEIMSRTTNLLRPLADKFNLSFYAFDDDEYLYERNSSNTRRSLVLSDAWGTALEPAPVTPTDETAYPHALLSGTIKATYNARRNLTGDNIVVSPGIMSGNSDTRAYWKLSKHIFRYTHQDGANGALSGLHGVNEFITADSFLEMITFFSMLILNLDESPLI